MFKPSCRAILIGSLPLEDHHSAIDLIVTHTPEIPLWPQLPRLPRQSMIRQFISGLPGFTEEGDTYWLSTGHDRFTGELTSFYEDYFHENAQTTVSAESRFALTPDCAQGFFTFIEKIKEAEQVSLSVKGQVTGPMTIGIGVKDQSGGSIFYDDNLRDVVVKLVSLNARWQVEQLKPYTCRYPPIIFIDEPGIVGFGSPAYTSVTREMVTDSVQEVIDGIKLAGGLAGVHVCANGDWAPVLQSSADIISFDGYSYFNNFILYEQPLTSFIKRGGVLAWGIVPTGDPAAIEVESVESLFTKWQQQFTVLINKGITANNLLEQTLITPSCGTGSLTIDQAVKVLSLTSQLSKKIRRHYKL